MKSIEHGTETYRMLTSRGGREWHETEKDEESQARRQRILSDILLSPNLVVICGLGTSLCICNNEGVRVAPTMQDLWADISKDASFNEIIEYISFPADRPDIEKLLSHCQLWLSVAPTPALRTFVDRAEKTLIKRCRFLDTRLSVDRHEAFLRKIGRRSTKLPRLKLFTTNYDTAFEVAASRTGFIVVDGFSHTSPQQFDGANFSYDFVRREEERAGPEYIPNVFHLYKIHGSVDWALQEGNVVRTPNTDGPLIIYPRSSKFETSYNPPFIEMMSRLQLALRQPNTGLLIIGFGFNDEHISQPLLAAIRSNVSLKAVIVGPSLGSDMENNIHIRCISDLICGGDDRLCLLEDKFETFVGVLPDLVAATEEEEHRGRLNHGNWRS